MFTADEARKLVKESLPKVEEVRKKNTEIFFEKLLESIQLAAKNGKTGITSAIAGDITAKEMPILIRKLKKLGYTSFISSSGRVIYVYWDDPLYSCIRRLLNVLVGH